MVYIQGMQTTREHRTACVPKLQEGRQRQQIRNAEARTAARAFGGHVPESWRSKYCGCLLVTWTSNIHQNDIGRYLGIHGCTYKLSFYM